MGGGAVTVVAATELVLGDPVDRICLSEAYAAALSSPDPSTQNGAYLVARDGRTVRACNTFPSWVSAIPGRLERPIKYSYIEHAERNAVFGAARAGVRTLGATLYCPWFACADCGRAILQAGITTVIGHKLMFDSTPDHWQDSISIAFQMFEEAGTELVLLDGPINAAPIRFNGESWSPAGE